MSNVLAGSLNGYIPEANKLEIASVCLNNKCNLNCKHCYLDTPDYSEEVLTGDEWNDVFDQILDIKTLKYLVFAGKEVFLNRDTVNVLFDAIDLKQSTNSSAQIGVITNGTLLENYYTDKWPNNISNDYFGNLYDFKPDYWDISIDGLPEFHDYIRGKGSFKKLETNLIWLLNNFKYVWITHTMMSGNLGSLNEFIRFYNTRYKVQYFSIGFYEPLEHTAKSQIIDNHFYKCILDNIERVRDENPDVSQIKVDFSNTNSYLVDLARERGYLIPENHSLRISQEGYILKPENIFDVKDYDKIALGNVRYSRINELDFVAENSYI